MVLKTKLVTFVMEGVVIKEAKFVVIAKEQELNLAQNVEVLEK